MNKNETTTNDVPTPGEDATPTDGVSPQDEVLNPESQSQENPEGRGSKRAVLGDLAKERDKRQAAEAERDELKKQLDAIAEKDMAELERAEKDRDELQKRLEALEKEKAEAERQRVVDAALKKAGLPAEMAGRLQGETEEELTADAAKLAEALGFDRRPVDPSQARSNRGGSAASLAEALRNHFNKNQEV